ncbi:MAG: hypothetical protein ABWX92_04690, partial [Mycetocola sp.]
MTTPSAEHLSSQWNPGRPPLPSWGRAPLWTAISVIEVALAVTAVILDLFIPALVLLALGTCSLAIRRQGPATLGARRPSMSVSRMLGLVVLLTVGWDLVTLLVIVPSLEFATATRQDVSGFAAMKGDIGLLLLMLALTWTLA